MTAAPWVRFAACALLGLPALLPISASAHECPRTSVHEIDTLFDEWNAALQSGDAHRVVALYAAHSILLPTISNVPRITEPDKLDYFEHFMALGPRGKIDTRWVEIDCASAIEAGIYTFTFADGSSARARYSFTYRNVDGHWLITSHHSSRMPEPGTP